MELRDPLDFERAIFAKDFDVRAFSRELRAVKPEDWIAIGTATDPSPTGGAAILFDTESAGLHVFEAGGVSTGDHDEV